MKPLSFATAPPRGPREPIAGLVFTARVVDKLRASLPGGELCGFLAYDGLSALWAHYTRIDLHALADMIESAQDESDIAIWITDKTTEIDKPTVNAKLLAFSQARLPESMRPQFEEIYPAELREKYETIVDLLEADDARLYGDGISHARNAGAVDGD